MSAEVTISIWKTAPLVWMVLFLFEINRKTLFIYILNIIIIDSQNSQLSDVSDIGTPAKEDSSVKSDTGLRKRKLNFDFWGGQQSTSQKLKFNDGSSGSLTAKLTEIGNLTKGKR